MKCGPCERASDTGSARASARSSAARPCVPGLAPCAVAWSVPHNRKMRKDRAGGREGCTERIRCSAKRVNFTHANAPPGRRVAAHAHHVAQLSMQVAGQPSADLRARGDAAGVGWRRARGASACAVVHVIVRGGYALAPQASLGKARRKKGRPPMMSEGARSVERLRLPRVSHLTTLPHEPIFPIGQKEAV